MENSQLIDELRHLLLEDDRKNYQELLDQVKVLLDEVSTRERIQERINPILEDRLAHLQSTFPEEYGPVLTKTIRTQIRDSQDEMIDVLHPIMGKLIKRYIQMEMQKLMERMDAQMSRTFSPERWKLRFKSAFTGVRRREFALQQLNKPTVEEVFLIQQGSGLLLGSFSKNHTLDQDMIAGMLTAIKGFVEEAFRREQQHLETIEYETYKILLKNFKTAYLAVVVTGVATGEFKQNLDTQTLSFAKNIFNKAFEKESETAAMHFSQQLKIYFEQF